MPMIVAVLALLVALAALAVSLSHTRRGRRHSPDDAQLPVDAVSLRREVSALRAEGRDALRHLAVVRYDAFGDMGGHLSWSLALLDDAGTGVVITSIHGRSDARTYAKSVQDWTSETQLSPEEAEAIGHARP